MVHRELAFSIRQSVALSLPAVAIGLQMAVESDMPDTHWAVPITTAGLGPFLVGGSIVPIELDLTSAATKTTFAPRLLLLGILNVLVGAALLGGRTMAARRLSGTTSGDLAGRGADDGTPDPGAISRCRPRRERRLRPRVARTGVIPGTATPAVGRSIVPVM